MKQIKMMALLGMTLFMGVIMTSCLSSKEGDNKTTQELFALYQNGTLEQYGGGILVPTNPNFLPAIPGIYSVEIEYDPTTWSDNKLSVTLLSVPVSVNNLNVRQGDGAGNINLYDLEYSGGMNPFMFNQDYIMIPCIFWMDNVEQTTIAYEKELEKHKFSLLVPDDLHNEEGILNLTLIDEVTDPEVERNMKSYVYQAFNIGSVISGFKSINGKIKTIRLWGNTNRNSYDPSEGRTEKKFVEIDLTPFQ